MVDVIRLLAESPALFIGTCLVLGLLVGSFLNVVIYRVPVMLNRDWRAQCAEFAAEDAAALGTAASAAMVALAEQQPAERFNLLVPRSACPKCKRPIRAYENIPV